MKHEAEITAFPSHRIVRMPAPVDMRDQLADNRRKFIDIIVNENTQGLYMSLMMSGLPVTTPDFQKNYSMIVEFLRAAAYKGANIPHGLQDPMAVLLKSVESLIPQGDFGIEPEEDEEEPEGTD